MDDRVKQELRIEKAAPGSEEAVIAEALDRVEPGDLVVYHRGVAGSARGGWVSANEHEACGDALA